MFLLLLLLLFLLLLLMLLLLLLLLTWWLRKGDWAGDWKGDCPDVLVVLPNNISSEKGRASCASLGGDADCVAGRPPR